MAVLCTVQQECVIHKLLDDYPDLFVAVVAELHRLHVDSAVGELVRE